MTAKVVFSVPVLVEIRPDVCDVREFTTEEKRELLISLAKEKVLFLDNHRLREIAQVVECDEEGVVDEA